MRPITRRERRRRRRREVQLAVQRGGEDVEAVILSGDYAVCVTVKTCIQLHIYVNKISFSLIFCKGTSQFNGTVSKIHDFVHAKS